MTKRLLNDAIRLAYGKYEGHPQWDHFLHFSYVVAGRQIVEHGVNLDGPPPTQFGYHDQSKLHSEFVAYRKARGLLKGATFEVVNVRINRSGHLKICAPCAVCQGWLAAVGCETVWFTLDGGGWGKTRLGAG